MHEPQQQAAQHAAARLWPGNEPLHVLRRALVRILLEKESGPGGLHTLLLAQVGDVLLKEEDLRGIYQRDLVVQGSKSRGAYVSDAPPHITIEQTNVKIGAHFQKFVRLHVDALLGAAANSAGHPSPGPSPSHPTKPRPSLASLTPTKQAPRASVTAPAVTARATQGAALPAGASKSLGASIASAMGEGLGAQAWLSPQGQPTALLAHTMALAVYRHSQTFGLAPQQTNSSNTSNSGANTQASMHLQHLRAAAACLLAGRTATGPAGPHSMGAAELSAALQRAAPVAWGLLGRRELITAQTMVYQPSTGRFAPMREDEAAMQVLADEGPLQVASGAGKEVCLRLDLAQLEAAARQAAVAQALSIAQEIDAPAEVQQLGASQAHAVGTGTLATEAQLQAAAAAVYAGSSGIAQIKRAAATALAAAASAPDGPHTMLSLHMGMVLSTQVPEAWQAVSGSKFKKVFLPSDGIISVQPLKQHVLLKLDAAALMARAGMGSGAAGGGGSGAVGPGPAATAGHIASAEDIKRWAHKVYGQQAREGDSRAQLKLALAQHLASVQNGPFGPCSIIGPSVGDEMLKVLPSEWAALPSPKVKALLKEDPLWSVVPHKGNIALQLLVQALAAAAEPGIGPVLLGPPAAAHQPHAHARSSAMANGSGGYGGYNSGHLGSHGNISSGHAALAVSSPLELAATSALLSLTWPSEAPSFVAALTILGQTKQHRKLVNNGCPSASSFFMLGFVEKFLAEMGVGKPGPGEVAAAGRGGSSSSNNNKSSKGDTEPWTKAEVHQHLMSKGQLFFEQEGRMALRLPELCAAVLEGIEGYEAEAAARDAAGGWEVVSSKAEGTGAGKPWLADVRFHQVRAGPFAGCVVAWPPNIQMHPLPVSKLPARKLVGPMQEQLGYGSPRDAALAMLAQCAEGIKALASGEVDLYKYDESRGASGGGVTAGSVDVMSQQVPAEQGTAAAAAAAGFDHDPWGYGAEAGTAAAVAAGGQSFVGEVADDLPYAWLPTPDSAGGAGWGGGGAAAGLFTSGWGTSLPPAVHAQHGAMLPVPLPMPTPVQAAWAAGDGGGAAAYGFGGGAEQEEEEELLGLLIGDN